MSRGQRRYARRGSAYAVRVVPVLYCTGSAHAVLVLRMLYWVLATLYGISYAVSVLSTLYGYYLCCRRVYLGCRGGPVDAHPARWQLIYFFVGKREYTVTGRRAKTGERAPRINSEACPIQKRGHAVVVRTRTKSPASS